MITYIEDTIEPRVNDRFADQMTTSEISNNFNVDTRKLKLDMDSSMCLYDHYRFKQFQEDMALRDNVLLKLSTACGFTVEMSEGHSDIIINDKVSLSIPMLKYDTIELSKLYTAISNISASEIESLVVSVPSRFKALIELTKNIALLKQ